MLFEFHPTLQFEAATASGTAPGTEPPRLRAVDAPPELRPHLLRIAARLGRAASAAEAMRLLEAEVEALRRQVERPDAPGATVVSDLEPVVMRFLEERVRRQEAGELGDIVGVPTGFSRLDRLLNGLQTGLYVLAGAPSVGKTTFLVQVADQVAASAAVLLVSFENPRENLVVKSLARLSRRDCLDLERGRVPLKDLHRAWERYRPLARRLYLADGGAHVTLEWLATQVRRIREAHGGQCVVMVDYLQKMLVNLPGATTKDRADQLAMGMRTLSRELEVPLLTISSQSRLGYQGGAGPRVSTLATLKESGEIEYSADVVLHLRPSEPNDARPHSGRSRPVWLDIEKNRYGEKGEVALVFHPALASFYEEGEPHAV